MSQGSLHSRASVLKQLNEPFFGFLPLGSLTLQHVFNTLVYFLNHPSKRFLSLLSLLPFLFDLVMELANLLRKHIGKDLTAFSPLLVLLADCCLDLGYLGSIGALTSIVALLTSLLLLS